MKNCKDCLHFDVCVLHFDPACDLWCSKCEDFKDKSRFIEVVRCKDCKHYKEYLDISTKEPTGWGKCECIAMDIDLMRNDFCSYAERKQK